MDDFRVGHQGEVIRLDHDGLDDLRLRHKELDELLESINDHELWDVWDTMNNKVYDGDTRVDEFCGKKGKPRKLVED